MVYMGHPDAWRPLATLKRRQAVARRDEPRIGKKAGEIQRNWPQTLWGKTPPLVRLGGSFQPHGDAMLDRETFTAEMALEEREMNYNAREINYFPRRWKAQDAVEGEAGERRLASLSQRGRRRKAFLEAR